MKKVGALASLGLLAFALWYFLSPFFAYEALRRAVKEGDAVSLEKLVDFASLRASLKQELKARILRNPPPGQPEEEDPWEQLFQALAGKLGVALVDPLVDFLVTPTTLAELLKQKEGNEEPLFRLPHPSWQKDNPLGDKQRGHPWRFSFPRWGAFRVDESNLRLWFQWRWTGWRLVRIEFRSSTLKDNPKPLQ
ncbi:DUF2939 domain-containing protein [Candidatus Methylacidithermus pantelleriae]|uniref:DUF2939 domain-containing protein n=1 Tax=Candidatus Methylacidithermus pantelleriae TaxID=2744239 RepID=UPI00157D2730|nr:DUF2939 domain-containing protein [Candidatus Methylacidithermus pantelleriae]